MPAAAVVIATGAIPLAHAREEAARLGPVVGFLAAVLVLARLCDEEGLFRACGAWMARAAHGRPRRLLAAIFVLASAVTAVLSLDATVVLLTPVVFVTASRLGARARPHVYACTHLSNTASLLLPVSNLTNLLAFAASGLAFTRFAGLMALPWLVAVGTEYLVFRRFFATDLDAGAQPSAPADTPPPPVFALAVLAGTLAGFVLTSALGLNPAWAAAAGAAVLAVRALAGRRTTVRRIVGATAPLFLAFVLSLGIVVRAVVDNGLGHVLGHVLPAGQGLPALLGTAALAAVLANVINNLPAVLVLLPLAVPSGTGAVLAVLVGVNVGPNLTYAGSLATLLWRRVVAQHEPAGGTVDGARAGRTGSGRVVGLAEFTRLGLLCVPPAVVLSVVALWASLHVLHG